MTAQAAVELATSRTAEYNVDGTRTYVTEYKVSTTSPLDGPQQVLQAPGLPKLGDSYTSGNDGDEEAICETLVPTFVGSQDCWRVTANWKTFFDERGIDGLPTLDPLDELPTIEVSFRQRQEAALAGTFLGPVDASFTWPGGNIGRDFRHPFLQVGELDAIQNSFGDQFDEPLMIDTSDFIIRVTRNEQRFDANFADTWVDTINVDHFRIEHFGFTAAFQPGQAKMNDITATQQQRTSDPYVVPIGYPLVVQNFTDIYWRVTYEVHYKEDTWNVFLLDKGKRVRAKPDNPDRRGRTIDEGETVPSGHARYGQEAVDFKGQPPGQDVLLGGDGLELAEQKRLINLNWVTIKQFPVFHGWRVYPQNIFGPLNL